MKLTGNEHIGSCTLVDEGWGFSVDGSVLVGVNWTFLVNRFANDIHDSSKGLMTDWHLDRRFGIKNWLSSH